MLRIAIIMSGALFLLSIVAFILKEKGVFLINGYYAISKDERELYDELKLSKDYGMILLKESLILLVGVIGYIFISPLILWIAMLTFIIYLVKATVTFRFDKYKSK